MGKGKGNKTYFLLNIFCLTDEIDKGMDYFIQAKEPVKSQSPSVLRVRKGFSEGYMD